MRNKKEGVSWSLTHPLFDSSCSFFHLHFFIFISNLSFYHLSHFSFVISHLSFLITNLGFHELLGSSELVSHYAQEFLTLLENVEINQGNLHQTIILQVLQAVDVFLAKH